MKQIFNRTRSQAELPASLYGLHLMRSILGVEDLIPCKY